MPKISSLGQKLWPTGRGQTDTQSNYGLSPETGSRFLNIRKIFKGYNYNYKKIKSQNFKKTKKCLELSP